MKNMTLDVPGMYGDHHVLRVRQALLAMTGVSEVTASAARRKVAVRFDETATSAEAIREALASAGYAPERRACHDPVPQETRRRLCLVCGAGPHHYHRAQRPRDGGRFPALLDR